MRVLIVSQYFAPEINAAANRVHAFAAGLVRRGHEVEVVCDVPNHPVGVVTSGFGGHFVERRSLDGARVKYVWVYVTSSKAIRPRLTNYVSFGITGALFGLATRRPDVIFASSPPLPVGGAGLAVAAHHRRPWVLDVRDLWPDAAVALGQVEEGPLLSAARRLERGFYRSSAAITVTTEPTRQLIEGRGGVGKVALISNGTTEDFLRAGAREPDEHPLGDRKGVFRRTYAGNLGMVARPGDCDRCGSGARRRLPARSRVGWESEEGARAARLRRARGPGRVPRCGPILGGGEADAGF